MFRPRCFNSEKFGVRVRTQRNITRVNCSLGSTYSDPELMSRLMQKWRKDGIIEEHRGVILLLDPKRLEALAEPR